MTLKIRLGKKEYPLSSNFPVYTITEGQICYDFYIFDDQNINDRIYYRVFSDQIKKTQVNGTAKPFTTLNLQKADNLRSLKISVEGGQLKKIDDINHYFTELKEGASKNPLKLYEILGIGEMYSDDDTLNLIAMYFNGLYEDSPEVLSIIHGAKMAIRQMSEGKVPVVIQLDTSSPEIFIDNINVGSLNRRITLSEGKHSIVIKNQGKKIASSDVEIKKGMKPEINLPIGIKGMGFPSFPQSSSQGTITPSTVMLWLALAISLWPLFANIHYYPNFFASFLVYTIVMGLVILGVFKQKKWGFGLLGAFYVYSLFAGGGIVSGLSFLILLGLVYIYFIEIRKWSWT